MSNQLTAKVTIHIDGQALESLPGAVINFGGEERTGVASDQGVAGYTAKHMVPSIKASFPDREGVDISFYQNITDATLSAITDTGKQYLFSNAWSSNAIEQTINDGGGFDVTFESRTMEQV